MNTAMSRKYTEQQKIEIYNNPVRIEMMPHDKMTKAEIGRASCRERV